MGMPITRFKGEAMPRLLAWVIEGLASDRDARQEREDHRKGDEPRTRLTDRAQLAPRQHPGFEEEAYRQPHDEQQHGTTEDHLAPGVTEALPLRPLARLRPTTMPGTSRTVSRVAT